MILFYINPILIAAAVIPAIVLLIKVYKSDKMDKEPIGLLVSLVLYGIIATGFAMLTECVGNFILSFFFDEGSITYNAIMYFLIVALSEEGFKYILLKKRTWYSPAFNYKFDGVVYAVFVSLGFALWENIGYVLMYGLSTAMVRAVTAVPGHACFGVFMGTWYGMAKKYDGYGYADVSQICRAMALLIPVLLHGFYDFTASFENQHYGWIFALFVSAMFLIAFLLVRKMSNNDEHIKKNTYFWKG